MPDEIVAPSPVAPAPESTPAPTPPQPAQPAAPAAPAAPARKSWSEALDALDELAVPIKQEPAKPAPTKAEAAPASPPKEPEAKKAEAKPAEKPAEPVQEKDDLPPFRTNAELRKWAKERNAAAATAEARRTELEGRLKELESVVPKSQQDSELLAQQIAQAQQRIQQYEQLVEVQAVEHSQKYQKEYAEPYYAARAKAEKEITELLVNEPTGEADEEGNPKMRQRPATVNDFNKIYSLPRAQAKQLAKQMFGDDADEVMGHRKTVSDLAEKAQEALVDRRKNFQTYKQQEESKKAQEQIAIQKLWETANEQISKDPKRAMYWGEDPDDPEANKALASGFKLADEFFSEERDNMKQADRVEFDAYIRHTIAMGPRLAYKVKKLEAENNALKEENSQLRGSAPGAPQPIGAETKPKDKNLFESISELPD